MMRRAIAAATVMAAVTMTTAKVQETTILSELTTRVHVRTIEVGEEPYTYEYCTGRHAGTVLVLLKPNELLGWTSVVVVKKTDDGGRELVAALVAEPSRVPLPGGDPEGELLGGTAYSTVTVEPGDCLELTIGSDAMLGLLHVGR